MNAKIYQGDADDALADLTEVDNVRDVSLNLEAGEADDTTRGNSGWRAIAPARQMSAQQPTAAAAQRNRPHRRCV